MAMALPGAHRLVRRRAGRVVIYWQAWRGGPPIGRFEGDSQARAEAAERAGAGDLARAYADARRTEAPKDLLAGLVARFRASPEFSRLAASTQAEWRRWLDRIEADLGTFPVLALKAKGARRRVIQWRNGFAAHPRKADYGVQVLRRLLAWAMDNELAEANPAEGIDELWANERPGEIVEPHELVLVLSRTTPAAARFFRLAAATGLRRGDLRRLQWSHVGRNSIELGTGKSRGRKRIIVPLVAEARQVLAECRWEQRRALRAAREAGRTPIASLHVMTSGLGRPWSKDGPTGAWVRAAAGPLDAATGQPIGPTVDKRLHHLRGNFATRLMAEGLTDEQIADIMGWEADDVAKIRRRYVDRDRIALLLATRIEGRRRNARATPPVNTL